MWCYRVRYVVETASENENVWKSEVNNIREIHPPTKRSVLQRCNSTVYSSILSFLFLSLCIYACILRWFRRQKRKLVHTYARARECIYLSTHTHICMYIFIFIYTSWRISLTLFLSLLCVYIGSNKAVHGYSKVVTKIHAHARARADVNNCARSEQIINWKL